ncbi:MAG: permease of phosphate ABC transporter [Firmicutes bacterium HGW-Firmicutes-11]|nr:MAG: permease of phosphate ABC transporter [Firmicutes bacterium HGW-Firmicutes-11]
MKELLNYGKKYMEKMNVADMAMLKTCVLSLGVLIGVSIPKTHKKKATAVASVAFAFTYAPLMTKFLSVVLDESKKSINEAKE